MDIWATGVLCFQLLSNNMKPWVTEHNEDIESDELERRICGKEIHWEHLQDESLTQARKFIEKCLTVDPKKRPSAKMLLQHPFMTQREHSRATTPILNQAL